MQSLLELDKIQLNRIDSAIAELVHEAPAQRERKSNLLHALESERRELIRCNPAIRLAVRRKAAA